MSSITLRPTMADVAREAGVSLSTVDRVLNLRADVRADTAQRISAAAARLGFHAKGVIEQRVRNDKPTVHLGFILQKSATGFYQGLAQALAQACAGCMGARVRFLVSYLDDLAPASVAQRIQAIGAQVDALAVVAGDHGQVREAIDSLRRSNRPVLALISALSQGAGVGYVGVDNRLMGRSAGWFVSRLAAPGPVAVMLSSQRFQCQELCELSFRSYLAEQPGDWDLLASRLTLEDDEFAYGNTLDLLTSEPTLAGLYVAGGGIAGALRALEELRVAGSRLPIVVCHDLTALTRQALKSGLVQAVLSHPLRDIAEHAVAVLVRALRHSEAEAEVVVLDIEIAVGESL